MEIQKTHPFFKLFWAALALLTLWALSCDSGAGSPAPCAGALCDDVDEAPDTGSPAPCTEGECDCEVYELTCDNTCVNPQSNAHYCGAKLGGNCSSDDINDPDYKGKVCTGLEDCIEGKCRCKQGIPECNGLCIDPKTNNDHCGAKGTCSDDDKDSANYKGEQCSAGRLCLAGECTCPTNYILCNGVCTNPLEDMQYCGAKGTCSDDDKNSANYKGEQCSAGRLCLAGECTCPTNYILCNGVCTNPLEDMQYCGAKGSCSDNDKNSANYKGEICNNGKTCLAGKCTCPQGFVLCGDTCIDPDIDNTHCGARGSCSDANPSSADYSGKDCSLEPHKLCIGSKCTQVSCDEGLQLCPSGDDYNCINVMGNDPNNCGACGWVCSDHSVNGATSNECKDGKCQYECPSDSTNCAPAAVKDSEPVCIFKSDQRNPYHCNACDDRCPSDYPVCFEKSCKAAGCNDKPNTCHLNGCENSDTLCGRSCVDCSKLPFVHKIENNASASCDVERGLCQISSCIEGYHLDKKDVENQCISNRVDRCAAPDEAEDGENTDCTKREGVALATCTHAGKCNALRCKPNYHLEMDKEQGVFVCKANSQTACGSADSLELRNCKENYGEDYQCLMGVCVYNKTDGNDKDSAHNNAEYIWCNELIKNPIPCTHIEGKTRYCARNSNNTFSCGYLCTEAANEKSNKVFCTNPDRCIVFGDGANCNTCSECEEGQSCYRDTESGAYICASCEDCKEGKYCVEDKTARFACTQCTNNCRMDQCYKKNDDTFACTECETACSATQNCYLRSDGNFRCTACDPVCLPGERCYYDEELEKFACTKCKERCDTLDSVPQVCYFDAAKERKYLCK